MDSVKVIDENTILVNLGATPNPASREYSRLLVQHGEGWAEVQKRADGLYVNGQKVVPHFSKIVGAIEPWGSGHYAKYLSGYELREEATWKEVLNANAADALLEHPHLIPAEWNEMTIWFSETTWTDSARQECAALRGIRRKNDQWEPHYHSFGPGWASVKVLPALPPEEEDRLFRKALEDPEM